MFNIARRAQVRAARIRLRPLVGRQLLPLVVVGLVFWVLRARLPTLDATQIWATLHQVEAGQWALAALASAASFWAVGRYDQVLHGLLGTGVASRQGRLAGTLSIAIAQFAGFGVLSGALVRWRLLGGLSLAQALRVSAAVSVSFLVGWAAITAIAILASGVSIYHARPIAVTVLVGVAMLVALLAWQPARIGGKRLASLPSLRAFAAITLLALVDTAFAGAALYALLPTGIAIAPATMFTAFLIALGAGLIGGTPGGIGPFEVALFTLLPMVPPDQLLASALAFRLVYYVLPAGLATIVLLRGPLAPPRATPPQLDRAPASPFLRPAVERALWAAPRAEANLLRQGDFGLLSRDAQPLALAAPVGQALVMLADPIGTSRASATGDTLRALADLADLARRRQRAPLLYKCSARSAACARTLGWSTLAIAQEAWLTPARFTTTGPAHRQLRRMLRKAHGAGIKVREGTRQLPLDQMQAVSEHWAARHGGERGFSMGRFGRDYVSCQRVFLAWRGDDLMGFVTLHEARAEWTLDLMRQHRGAPDGTMHLLVRHAIASAAAAQCARLSLAALPHPGSGDAPLVAAARARLIRAGGGDGLRRFKASFGPNWQPLYAAAPGRIGLALGLLAIAARINGAAAPRRARSRSL
jgi:phosphatidylglycerol lysyltransferase